MLMVVRRILMLPRHTNHDLLQEKEEGLRREQDSLGRAKDRLERERSKAVQDQNLELRAALRRAEAERYAFGALKRRNGADSTRFAVAIKTE